MSLFVTNDPDREVIYMGEKPLNIISCISHTIEWTLNFSQAEVEKNGVGTAEKLS